MMSGFFKMLWLALVMAITASCAGTDPEHGHDHEHGSHDGHDDHDEPTGSNGGRLLEQSGVIFEVKIEEGVSPRFRVWLTRDQEPIESQNVELQLETRRLLGAQERFSFRPDQGSWLATTSVGEPHSFDVVVTAQIGGERISTSFASYEGRTVIDSTAAAEAGIVTAEATGGAIVDTLPAMGVFRTASGAEAVATARFPGVIKNISVQVGDRVSRGDVVAVIDGNLSLAPYNVTSPLTGVIAEQLRDVGAHVDGEPILRVIDPRRLVVELSVFGAEIDRLRKDQRVRVLRAGESRSVEGKVARLTPDVKSASQGASVQVELIDTVPDWPPGTAVTGQIILQDAPVKIRVPRTALQTFWDWDVVFVREGDIYEVQPVVIGRQDAEFAEIVDGLSGGETIVIQQSFLVKADIEKSAAVHDH